MAFHSRETKSQSMEIMVEKDEDRISSLPDDVRSHILSFVELREAVRTLVLSKRWEKVWTSIHHINLDNQSCVREFHPDLSQEEENKRRTSFINFVNGILTGNNRILSMTSFCLWYYFGWPEHTIHQEIPYLIKWIAAAITPSIEKFDFCIAVRCMFPSIKMTRTLYECQKLVILKLHSLFSNMIYLDVPETVCLPCLEKLHLANVKFKDDNSLKKLLSGCPVLEELYMNETESSDVGCEKRNLFVFSPSLKILRLEDPICSHGFGSCYVVEAPKLEYLEIVEHCLLGFNMTASPSLVSAVLDICTCSHSSLSVIGLFQGISNVQNLELSTHKTIMLKYELDNLPEFGNLIHLKIGRCKSRHIIPCILQHSPHLKHLIFDEGLFSSKSFIWSPPDWVPKCLTMQLEMIEIVSLVGRNEEEAMKMIEYLLGKGRLLKKMAITSFPDKKVVNKLMGFSKASIGCQIEFSTFPVML